MKRVLAIFAALAVLSCHGCDSNPSLPPALPVPVKGKITYRGKPLTRGKIVLEPTDGGRDATGKIQPDGRFVMTTNQESDGAKVGVYRVVVAETDPQVQVKKEAHVRVTEGQTEYVIDLK